MDHDAVPDDPDDKTADKDVFVSSGTQHHPTCDGSGNDLHTTSRQREECCLTDHEEMDHGSPRIQIRMCNTEGKSVKHTGRAGEDDADVSEVTWWRCSEICMSLHSRTRRLST